MDFVGKVTSLLFNMLSRLVITFFPRSECLLISWLQSPSAVILEPPQNKVWHRFHCFPIYFPWSDGTRCHDLHFLNVEFQTSFFTFLVNIVNKKFERQNMGAISKMTEWSLFISKANHSISQLSKYAPTSNAEETEVEGFYEDLQDLLELTPKKDVLFIIGDWNAKVGSQETPGVTGKFGLGMRNEAGQRLIESCQENALVIANTLFQQHKRRLYTWTSPDGQHWNHIDYILCSQRWRFSIQSAKSRLGADCGSVHELLIAKFRL